MKRDMDLVREILLKVEGNTEAFGMDSVEIEARSQQEIGYHIKIMVEAGLLEAGDRTHMGADAMLWHSVSLTWRGHEFLDAARDNTRWNGAKKLVAEKGVAVSFDVLKDVLAFLAKQTLGLP